MTKIEEVRAAVEAGKAKLIAGLVQEALDGGGNAKDILDAMVSAMGVVGDKFSCGEVFVPEMLMAAKAMQKGVDILKPLLASESLAARGTCIIGTVAGDLHDIGKNLVAMMIGSAGFEVVDLGVDVSTQAFIDAIKAHKNVTLVACSGLLTTTMPAMRETVQALKVSGLSGFKVIVGGAPVSQSFADEIGADGYSADAGSAAVKAAELVPAA